MQFMCWTSLCPSSLPLHLGSFLPLGCLCLCLRLSCPGDVLSVNLHVTWHLYWHWIAFCLGLPSYAGGSLLVCVCLSTASCRTSLPASFVCQRLLVRLYLLSSCICVFVYLTIKVLRAAWTSSRFKCVNCCSLKQLFSCPHLTLWLYLGLLHHLTLHLSLRLLIY